MSAQSANEFALIKQFFSQGFPLHKNTVVAVGDDCSVVTPPKQHALAQSIDTFVANIHFPANAPAELIAERCLRCATSDLAAMGARSEEHTSELQSRPHLVCRLLLEKKK